MEGEALELIDKEHVLAIVGLSGVGKTSALYGLAAMMMRRERERRVPVVLRLADVSEVQPRCIEVRLLDGLGGGENQEGIRIPVIEIPKTLSEQEIISLMGGLTEVLIRVDDIEEELKKNNNYRTSDGVEKAVKAVAKRLNIAKELAGFLNRNPILVSFMAGVAGHLLNSISVATLTLAAFSAVLWLRQRKRRREAVKNVEKVVILFDDANVAGDGKANFVVKKLLEATGGRMPYGLVFVVRVDVRSGDEYLDYALDPVAEVAKRLPLGFEEGWSGRVLDLVAPGRELFARIIEANRPGTDRELVERLFKATGGAPAVALMLLDAGIDPSEVIPRTPGYVPLSFEFASRCARLAAELERARLPELRDVLNEVLKLEERPVLFGLRKAAEELKEAVSRLLEERPGLTSEQEAARRERISALLGRVVGKLREGAQAAASNALASLLASAGLVYRELLEANVGYIALIAQPIGVALDELEEFCARMSSPILAPILAQKVRLGKVRLEELEEEWGEILPDGTVVKRPRKVIALAEPSKHLPYLLEELGRRPAEALPEGLRGLRPLEDLLKAKKTMLDIMTEASLGTGWSTDRTVLSALEHIDWLSEALKEDERANWDDIALKALKWAGDALRFFPRLGLAFLPRALEFFEKSSKEGDILLFAAALAGQGMALLRGGLGYLPLHKTRRLYGHLVRLMAPPTDDEAVLAWRAFARATAAAMWLRTTPWDVAAAERDAEEVSRLLDGLSEPLRSLIRAEMANPMADYLRSRGQYPEARSRVEEALKLVERLRAEVDELASDPQVARLYRPFGGHVRAKLARRLGLLRSELSYRLGGICLDMDELKEAVDAFRLSWRRRHELKVIAVAWIGDVSASHAGYVRASLIRGGVGARPPDLNGAERGWAQHFREMWKTAKGHRPELTPEVVFTRYVEALVADAFERPRELMEYLSSEEGWHEFEDIVLGWPDKAAVGALLGTLVLLLRLRAGLSPGDRIERTASDVLSKLNVRFWTLRLKGKSMWSALAFAVILHDLLRGDIKLAVEVAGWASKRTKSSLLNRLFKELARAIRAYGSGEPGSLEALAEAIIRLFYYHW